MRLGAHWCDFQRHVALFNSLFYYIKAHIFDKNRHFLRKKSKMCAFEFRIFNHPVKQPKPNASRYLGLQGLKVEGLAQPFVLIRKPMNVFIPF